MCGIAGIVRFDDTPVDSNRLGAMLAHMQHRGPDGTGQSVHGRCGLAHARLSIIDLLSGHQPMQLDAEVGDGKTDHHDSLRLVFNGEIYNHHALRRKLEKRGHRFHSDHSDTEVLLLGYRQWGDDLPKHLDGMFAFALWDDTHRRLFLCRDRAGKKPLYLRWSNDRRELLFGSLVGTVVAGLPAGKSAEVNDESLLNYLRLGYPFEQSMVRGVKEIPAAHSVTIDANGDATLHRYWQPPPLSKTSTSLGLLGALREVVTESVGKRLEADVPIGCFLSGGIDSSVIAAVAQQHLQRRGEGALRTFSVAMPQADYDETAHAKLVAAHIGADHTVLQARVTDAMDDLYRLMDVAGEPTADSSLLPTFWLCKAARGHVKAALSGDGGDEMFGGYDRYRAMRLLSRHASWIARLPAGLIDSANPRSRRARLARLARAAAAGAGDPSQRYHSMVHLFDDADIAALMPDRFAGQLSPRVAPLPGWINEHDHVHAAMRWDLTHYLPFELLRKVDRASMACALEVRCPLLDTAVADLAGHIPPRLLMPGGKPKGLLRQMATDLLPASIVARPKRGFAVPIGGWFRTTLKDPLADHLFGDDLPALGVAPAPVRRLFDEHTAGNRDHTHRLFALLQLAIWHRRTTAPGSPGARAARLP